MRALLVANSDDCDAGFTGERFRHHGFGFVECLRERPHEWPALTGIDLVVLLGSEWSVYWPHVGSEVAAEIALIQAARHANVPIYGICFGMQVLAAACGGQVERGDSEVGWYDDVVSELPMIPGGPWLQWHQDVVTPPTTATVLARSPRCVQAIRLGRSFATQFHPEVNEAMITRWVAGADDTLGRFGLTPDVLREQTSRHVLVSRPRAEALVDWFLATVAVA
jgi:GMP synthase (glutamine-hydrolysing)